MAAWMASYGLMVKSIACALVENCLLGIPEQLVPYLKLSYDSRAKSTPKKSYSCTNAMEEVCGCSWKWRSEQRASAIATQCRMRYVTIARERLPHPDPGSPYSV